MKEEILKLSRHTLIYGAGTLINKAIGFIMLPVYTRYLTPADYGTLELLTMTLDVISFLVGMGITSTVFKYYHEYSNLEEKKEVISTSIILLTFIWLIAASIGLIISKDISVLIFGHKDNEKFFKLLFIMQFLQSSMIVIPLMFIRAMQNSKLFVYINLIKLLLQVIFNIIFVVVLKIGIQGILYSTLIADSVIGSYLITYTVRKVGFRFSMTKGKRMIRFGYFFVFVSVSSFILTYSDRYFLNTYSTLNTVGIYSLAYKFAFLLGYLILVPFMQIWEPYRFEVVKKEYAQYLFQKIFLYFNIGLITLSLLISLLIKDVLMIMADQAFLEAYKIAPVLIFAYIFQAWTFFCNLGIYIHEKSKYMALAYLISAASIIIFNFFFVPRYGAYGAAISAVCAFFIRFFLTYRFSQIFYYIDYDWKRQILLLLLAIGVYSLGRFFYISHIAISIAFNFFLIICFLVVVYLFFLDLKERIFILENIRNSVHYIRSLVIHSYHK